MTFRIKASAKFKTNIPAVKTPKAKKTRRSALERRIMGLSPLEDEIQIQIIKECAFLKYQGFKVSELIRHIPNGGLRSKTEAARFKEMGVIAGTPDLLLPVARGGFSALWIELKSEKGRLRPEQEVQIKLLQSLGNKVVFVRNVADAMAQIKSYLGI
ncbi:TPA: VRR-NUC domain-containing protein [Acinetobacter baumannii]|uniref:VRR-NUC domain-containing protein n=1 Tax=Acinetobacter TaxID=469 RepID=UPI0002CEB933|nr:VRR-NUC domain-containing protein [Acinetobacter baumannii]EKT7934322.1 VRR-NUC domain-containing protein [Acinetobacter baumannii]EKT8682824.1 VRR-NUC domain-containing protein [Acinetobacter baumannii]EKT9125649.1 VRR-NUC domain-containing protein [Acinetobacter baumannii]EKT9294253.1 VRR-NUC domain-containing protein [Acinetobacter baumannii]EKU3010440.1 VRR-NUC domain-containing protein [Acinetobacter baumannii]